MLCITGIQLSTDIILTVYSRYKAMKQRDSVVLKYVYISDMNIEKIFEILRNIWIDDLHYGHSIKCQY
jgi:hypothetical protein